MLWALAATGMVAYMSATFLHLGSLFKERPWMARGANIATAVGLVVHLGLVVALIVTESAAALLTVQGGVLLGGLGLAAVYLLAGWRMQLWTLGSLVLPLCALSVMASRFGHEPSTPSTDSLVLPIHIILAMLGTLAFAMAFAAAVLYVITERQLKAKRFGPWLRRLPSLDKLDTLGVRVVLAGFAVYTVAILLGFLWSWQNIGLDLEPRTLLAVLTWVIYGLIIQARLTVGWRGRKAAWLTIIGALGAVGVVLTYFLRG